MIDLMKITDKCQICGKDFHNSFLYNENNNDIAHLFAIHIIESKVNTTNYQLYCIAWDNGYLFAYIYYFIDKNICKIFYEGDGAIELFNLEYNELKFNTKEDLYSFIIDKYNKYEENLIFE